MMEQGLQHAQRLATLLSGGIRGTAYYPPGHPASLQPFREMAQLAALMHREVGEIRLGVADGVLSVAEHLFFAPTPPLEELSRRFEEKGIFGITLRKGVTDQELMALARLMGDTSGGAAEIIAGLAKAGISSIEVKEEDPLSQTYNEAVSAIRDVFHEIGSGRIPNSRRMLTVVSSLASVAVREPAALVGLSLIKDYDNYTFQHSVNVGVLSMALAASMGLKDDQVEAAGLAGFLHDIGKTRINKVILNKPGKLSSEEFVEMKKHPEYGAEIVRGMEGVPAPVAEAVLGHHIRQDREGYPAWAKGESFGIASAIVAVADCYDAATTLRSYQAPMIPKDAVERIRSMAGSSLDPKVVEHFVELSGKYPTGSLVRLDSNEIAVVTAPSSEECGAALVKVIIDGAGNALAAPQARNLPGSGGFIVAAVDPLVRGIEVSRYL